VAVLLARYLPKTAHIDEPQGPSEQPAAPERGRHTEVSMHKVLPRLGYTIDQVVASGAFANRSAANAAIARGDVETWKEGKRRMISAASVRAYIKKRIADAKGV
jgi:hypothetical protein